MSDQSADVSRRAFLRAGAGATAVAAGAGTAAAQEEGGGGGGNVKAVFPSYVSDANGPGYEDMRGSSEVTVEVGAGSGGFAFAPTNIWVDAGTTVVFEFVAPSHNVKPNTQPDGGGLAGTEGGQFATIPEGETYEVTLETGGMYTYNCAPHEGQGMKGAIAVGGDVETEELDTGGGGSTRPQVPDAAKSLGIATGFGMAATLGLGYFFIKYGGDYGEYDE
ncbi:halocyanin precursor-like protein [Halosimplex carlsbadense 2-9-1]|uniref:Halocyanin-like protein n=1 Tax=Halosimplex carlsbadense 2-9-1 TaxID=797114 RepID=M0CTP7_9EURY|nr:plastocyanin/azurin family copper-binding protein [Halosimplex carlsbadense]ELZ25792.1 halocyanin precursor-like protein [Halosimplex carlsbadense 2-9-1]